MGRVATAAAIMPVVVAGVGAAIGGWVATWDDAYPALRAADVFSRRPPLLGTQSAGSGYAQHLVHHPGPMEFVLLAPWVQVFGRSAGTALGTAAINVAAIIVVAWLTRRRAGQAGQLIAMAVMASLAWSMGRGLLFDPWPNHVTLFPFAALLVAGWSVADRDLAALPILVASASFVVQTHLGYSLLAPAVIATSCVMFVWRLRQERPDDRHCASWLRERRRLVRWTTASASLGLLCWLPPLYEQATHPGGNLTALIDAVRNGGGGLVLSFGTALRLFAGTVALPPWWMPPSFESPAVDWMGRGLSLPSAWLVMGVLAAAMMLGARRARRRHSDPVATGLWFALGIVPWVLVTAANAPMDLALVLVDRVRFVWVAAAFVGMMLLVALVDELRQFDRLRRRSQVGGRAVLVAVTVVFGVCGLNTVDRKGGAPQWSPPVARHFADELIPALRGEETVLVDMYGPTGGPGAIAPGLAVLLEDAGIDVVVRQPSLTSQVSTEMVFDGRASARVMVVTTQRPRSPTARLVGEFSGRSEAEEDELTDLRVTVRDALRKAGGLRLHPNPEVPNRLDFASRVAELTAEVARLNESSRDPAGLLASDALISLVHLVDSAMGSLDAVIADDDFPSDQLARYAHLKTMESLRGTRVYLDPTPRFWPGASPRHVGGGEAMVVTERRVRR